MAMIHDEQTLFHVRDPSWSRLNPIYTLSGAEFILREQLTLLGVFR